jgi:hypothetical protein
VYNQVEKNQDKRIAVEVRTLYYKYLFTSFIFFFNLDSLIFNLVLL